MHFASKHFHNKYKTNWRQVLLTPRIELTFVKLHQKQIHTYT